PSADPQKTRSFRPRAFGEGPDEAPFVKELPATYLDSAAHSHRPAMTRAGPGGTSAIGGRAALPRSVVVPLRRRDRRPLARRGGRRRPRDGGSRRRPSAEHVRKTISQGARPPGYLPVLL